MVKQTPLYQLIQYAPATEKVLGVPLIIFPPWINRFYILDLNPKKSFIQWAVDQGLTVFVVSWKSADESLRDVTLDDYVLAEVEAVDAVRKTLDVENVHVIGYCVAGTMLAAALALMEARGEADKVASATFFTAQVDFSEAGDLKLFIGDEQMELIRQMSADKGYLDGRYMAATFNMLRGRDLIWSYVTSNYLLGEDYPQFDLLHWNSDTTNLPADWHRAYLQQLYRDNKLVQPGGVTIAGVPIDLRTVKVPTYIQAGREDHIAPPQSVWKITRHFTGPLRFVLAGSGHIAGVVNPPAAGKYQYWTNDAKVGSLDEFIAGGHGDQGQLVARLDPMDPRHCRRRGQGQGRAQARQGQARGDRGRAGELCEGAVRRLIAAAGLATALSACAPATHSAAACPGPLRGWVAQAEGDSSGDICRQSRLDRFGTCPAMERGRHRSDPIAQISGRHPVGRAFAVRHSLSGARRRLRVSAGRACRHGAELSL